MSGVLLTSSDLLRIKQSLEQGLKCHGSRDADLRDRCAKRVSSWSNTVETNCLKYESEKLKRREDLEVILSRIDAEEADSQLLQRNEVVQRANALLVSENDRVKTMNSAMMLADTLAERDNQIRIKEQLEKLEHIRNLKYDEMVKHNVSRIRERENLELKKLEERKQSVAAMQKEQLHEARARFRSQKEAERIEGELIRERNEAFLAAEVERKRYEREVALNAQKETMRAQEYLNEIKAREQERVRREEEKIAQYAKAKEEMLAKRKERESAIFMQKQDLRQRLIDAQAAKLQDLTQAEETRIAQQCRDAEAEQNRLLAERAEKTLQWKRDVDQSRRAQLERKLSDKAKQLVEEEKAAQFCRLLFEKLEQDERAEQAQRRDAAKRLEQDLQIQIAMKQRRSHEEKSAETDLVCRAKRGIQADSDEFRCYAESIIKEYAESGKNVLPLIQALKDFHRKMPD